MFSIDNTNTVESYFSVIKGRINKTTTTLADIYKSVNFAEISVLAARNPASPTLPDTVVDVLLTVVTRDVVNILTTDGVRGLLNVLCLVSLDIILDKRNRLRKGKEQRLKTNEFDLCFVFVLNPPRSPKSDMM